MSIGEVVRELFGIELKHDGSVAGFKGLAHILDITLKKTNKSKARGTLLANISDVSAYTFRSLELYCTFAIFLIELQSDKDLWIYLLNGRLGKMCPVDRGFLLACCEFFINQCTILPLNDKNWKYAVVLLRVVTLEEEFAEIIENDTKFKSIFKKLITLMTSHKIADFQLLNTIFSLMVVVGVEESGLNEIMRSKKQRRAHLLGNPSVLNMVVTNYTADLVNFYRVQKCCMLYKKNHLISKKLLAIPDGNGNQYCYIQVIYSNIYIWAGSNLLLQIHQKSINMTKTSETTIVLNFIDENSLPLQIAFNGFGKKGFPSEYLVGIELRIGNSNDTSKLVRRIEENFRISEAKNYLLLNYSDTDGFSEVDCNGSNQNPEEKVEKPVDMAKEVQVCPLKNTQLHTPERSDLKRSNDEWELKDENTNEGTLTPKNLRQYNNLPINEIESSPLEGVCKRNLQRQLSKCAEILKKDLRNEYKTDLLDSIEVMQEEVLNPSSSLVITKYDKIEPNKKFVNEGRLTSQFLGTKHNKLANKHKPLGKNIDKKTQMKENITMLNTIFGRPEFKIKKTAGPAKKKYTKKTGKLTKIIEKANNTKLLKAKDVVSTVECDGNSTTIQNEVGDSTETAIVGAHNDTTLVPKDSNDSTKDINVVSNILEEKSIKKEPMNAFALSIQEQLAQSLNQIANQMVSRITLINEELNKKIMKDLSEKYKNIFNELQLSFQNDVDNMTNFLSEIEGLNDMSEKDLAILIRQKKVIETELKISAKTK